MWYYQKDGHKVGPFADSALRRYYELGRINDDTLIWFNGLSVWTPLNKTERFSGFFRRVYKRLDSYTHRTRIFRGLLLAFAALNIISIFFDYKHILYYEKILNAGGVPTDFLKLYALEFAKISKMYIIFLLIVLVFLLKEMIQWFHFSMYNVKLFDKGFNHSPIFYSISYLIPVVNIVAPYYAIWNIFRVSKLCLRKRMNIFDANYIVLFWFFNLFTIVSNIILFVLRTGSYDMEVELGFIVFDLLCCILVAFTCFLWFLIVSKIYNIQARVLMNFE